MVVTSPLRPRRSQEASLREFEVLRWMAVAAPVWVAATFVVCLYHISRHAFEMHRPVALLRPGSEGRPHFDRDPPHLWPCCCSTPRLLHTSSPAGSGFHHIFAGMG